MDFKKATDELFDRVDHAELAQALGVSIATIRQARLNAEASAHRSAPSAWRDAVIRLAEERVGHYTRLIEEVRGMT
jgi:hypothetical protein